MKRVEDDDLDVIRAVAPEKRLAAILLLLFTLDVVDDDDYLYMVEAAREEDATAS